MDELIAQLGNIIRMVLERGFKPPLYAVPISLNGSIFVVRYEAGATGWEATPLAGHDEDGGFVLPINIMITDSRGEAARVAIGRSGPPTIVN